VQGELTERAWKHSAQGSAALIPGVRGAMEVARFRLTAGLPDPRKN
jgi:hypothetical protein